MDTGLIFVFGVAFGLLGGVGFVLLLIGSDDYATAYFRAYWSRLGGQREQVEAQGSNGKPKENVSQSTESQTVEPPRPACGSAGRGISASSKSTGGVEGHASTGTHGPCASSGGGRMAVETVLAAGIKPGPVLLLLALLVSGCASVGGGVGDVHGATRSVRDVKHSASAPASEPFPTSPRTEELPVCGFEAPYLPDPCRLEVAPGEWLRISNPKPKETKKHGWLWWLLISLVTL